MITRFDHPSSLDADEMFVLRAESDLWAQVLLGEVGDQDMLEPAELLFANGMHPQFFRHVRLVASDVDSPAGEQDVVGVATLEFPMSENRRLATASVVVRQDRRREGIGSALHAAAMDVVREVGRSTVRAWTYEPAALVQGVKAGTGFGEVGADSPASRFLSDKGYVLGQVERISRLDLPAMEDANRRRDEAWDRTPDGYDVITLAADIPPRLFSGVAELSMAMSSDSPTLDTGEESWDEERMRLQMESVRTAQREQVMTLIRHISTGRLVAFTRMFRDHATPEVAHQWETIVLDGHRGHGLGVLMKVVNLAAAVELWPEARRLVTGNASENSHILAINEELGFQPYAASGLWELSFRGTDS